MSAWGQPMGCSFWFIFSHSSTCGEKRAGPNGKHAMFSTFLYLFYSFVCRLFLLILLWLTCYTLQRGWCSSSLCRQLCKCTPLPFLIAFWLKISSLVYLTEMVCSLTFQRWCCWFGITLNRCSSLLPILCWCCVGAFSLSTLAHFTDTSREGRMWSTPCYTAQSDFITDIATRYQLQWASFLCLFAPSFSCFSVGLEMTMTSLVCGHMNPKWWQCVSPHRYCGCSGISLLLAIVYVYCAQLCYLWLQIVHNVATISLSLW